MNCALEKIDYEKASPKQWEHLEGDVLGYQATHGVKGKVAAINNFIKVNFLPSWWKKFPLTGERTANGDHTHMKQWFQNHGSIKKTATRLGMHDLFSKQQSHTLKAEKVYSQRYYKAWVKPIVNEKKKGCSSQGEMLKLVKETTKEVFVAKADDIHEEILKETKEQAVLVPGKDGVMTPEMYATALQVAPSQIKLFTKVLADATGTGVLLIFGGPNPWDERGKIVTYGSLP
ncbi:hypothetical protein ARMGADRAFT_1038034 [Armillaria gallica]|uniref:Uncharacterized protein n=1 Tax=Armillaria gallica TaxID=47427 RepID=A0A2H3CXM9_ARMGA|nr:hypothetical protein ARMGADRAFT_1038034 [Armillaria gallica]